jgi:hypothetical protein
MCEDNTALQNGVCSNCSIGMYISLRQCFSCPDSCIACQNTTYCTSCKDSFYYYNNFCYSSCPIDKIPSGKMCITCV